ncbi:hypothetical protein OBBRIDRAFT_321379 [Obba rivulosa]|uniref:Uncharacterized protein n=1 Tax=Obba rivulosa TaxID=1052685 RepID=A0A8E2AL40_9APHY|nr:hypothetical protein OBBRIDRAFT_321379 [Obba rivulosa]
MFLRRMAPYPVVYQAAAFIIRPIPVFCAASTDVAQYDTSLIFPCLIERIYDQTHVNGMFDGYQTGHGRGGTVRNA